MANNVPFKTIPGTIDIPSDLNSFKNKDQVVWTGSSWRTKGSFTPGYGDKNHFKHDPSYSIQYQKDMYNSSDSTGLGLKGDAGNEHQGNYELYGDGRWMPASIFNGVGFEVYQDSSEKHAIYLRYYALVFANRDGGSYRIWGVDTGARNPSKGYRYIRVPSGSATVNSIRGWGPSWLFQGIIAHIWNNGGSGKTQSYMYIYNMKVGSKMSTIGGQYRYIPAGKRPYGQRDPRYGNGGLMNFTSPLR